MFLWIIKPFRVLAQAFISEDTPKQLAMGLALGMMVGLVPKGNLISLTLIILLFTFKANLGVGLISAFVFTWVGYVCDNLGHHLGEKLLTNQALQGFWTWLYDLPVLPWTGFNNTVVLGTFMLSLYLFFPTYLAGVMFFERYQPWFRKHTENLGLVRWLRKAELAARFETAMH